MCLGKSLEKLNHCTLKVQIHGSISYSRKFSGNGGKFSGNFTKLCEVTENSCTTCR